VVLILKRGRHDVRGCTVKLTAERAIAMSHDKYCSASVMLAKTADITTSFEVFEV
jgi:putative redox protein